MARQTASRACRPPKLHLGPAGHSGSQVQTPPGRDLAPTWGWVRVSAHGGAPLSTVDREANPLSPLPVGRSGWTLPDAGVQGGACLCSRLRPFGVSRGRPCCRLHGPEPASHGAGARGPQKAPGTPVPSPPESAGGPGAPDLGWLSPAARRADRRPWAPLGSGARLRPWAPLGKLPFGPPAVAEGGDRTRGPRGGCA